MTNQGRQAKTIICSGNVSFLEMEARNFKKRTLPTCRSVLLNIFRTSKCSKETLLEHDTPLALRLWSLEHSRKAKIHLFWQCLFFGNGGTKFPKKDTAKLSQCPFEHFSYLKIFKRDTARTRYTFRHTLA